MSAPAEERVPAAKVLEVVDRWVAEGGVPYLELGETMAKWIERLRSGAMRGLTIDQLDRLLVKMDLPGELDRIAPPRSRGGYTWAKPHPLRKITTGQARACWVIHWQGGISVRELGRRLYERFGYSSPRSCAAALEQAWRREGWPVRPRAEAVLLANDRLGYVRGRTRRDRKRERTARLKATPEGRARIAAELEALHRREGRRAS